MRETVAVMQPDLILSLALSARILPATSEGDGSARRGGTGWKSTEHFSTVAEGALGAAVLGRQALRLQWRNCNFAPQIQSTT